MMLPGFSHHIFMEKSRISFVPSLKSRGKYVIIENGMLL